MSSGYTYGQVLHQAKERLLHGGIDEAETDAWILFEECFSMSRSSYFMRQEEVAPKEKVEEYEGWITLRLQHIPTQHLTGYQEFMGYRFMVNEHVLVPRQDTELLVEEALKQPGVKSVLDLCTGSGCIGISLKLLNHNYEVTASDLSVDALAVARQNAVSLGADLSFIQSDLFEQIPGRYDMIVSNPPYISVDEIQTLAPEVKEHDPYGALCGGEDGLDFYRRIVKEAKSYLNQKGVLLMEIGCRQAKDVSEMCEACGYTDIRVIKDYAGLDRVVSARMLILK